MTELNSATSATLLSQLRLSKRDEAGWTIFVERYGPKVYGWCLNRRLQAADAEEVTQNVLVKMAEKLHSFEYDPAQSFRGWLRVITENAVKDYCKGLKNENRGEGGSEILLRLAQLEATEDLSQRLNETFDLELAEEAMSRVRTRVSTDRWMAWHLTAREGLPGAVVATKLNMKVVSVYTARNQIQNQIREEIEKLEKSLPRED
ncbi:sigma-70 family RNA polymerase sigma factor [uncultured Rubinisphaera sp.]|uniref:RNA polymerase sigma factor n=1 Tax=uncultured Rubinisphaera sp. TaxID=1678686 RepID=UPI0030DC6260|tara:strand:+ start:774 stop:1385 length:612 start_codon:yes stop_codon:yes gene_type:complete